MNNIITTENSGIEQELKEALKCETSCDKLKALFSVE